jgi:tetratricopeptide (TPR) repeat protein
MLASPSMFAALRKNLAAAVFLLAACAGFAADAPAVRQEVGIYLERSIAALTVGEVEEARDIVTEARAKIDGLDENAKKDPATRRLMARLLVVHGRILVEEDDDAAEDDWTLLEEARKFFLEACDIFETLRKASPREPDLAIENAECLLYAAALHDAFRNIASRSELHNQAVQILRDCLRAHPMDADVRHQLAETILTQAEATKYVVEHAKLRRRIQQAVDLLAGLAEEDPDDLEIQAKLAVAHNHLGNASRELEDAEAGRAAFQRALEIWDSLLERLPEMTEEILDRKTAVLNGLAGLEKDGENFGEAMRLLQEVQTIYTRLAGLNPDDAERKFSLASGSHVMGVVAMLAEDHGKARQLFNEALEGYQTLAAEFPGGTDADENIILVRMLLGDVALVESGWREALSLYETALVKAEEEADLSDDDAIVSLMEWWTDVYEKAEEHGDTNFLRKANARRLELAELYFNVASDREMAFTMLIGGHVELAHFSGDQQDRETELRHLAKVAELSKQMEEEGVALDDKELLREVKKSLRKLERLRKE